MPDEAMPGKEPAGDPPTDHAKYTPPPVGEIHNHFTYMTEQKPLTKEQFIQQFILARATAGLNIHDSKPNLASYALAHWNSIEDELK
jgi:hypothetical protein